MKKTFAALLVFSILPMVLIGCSEKGENSDLNIYSEASYDNESKFIPSEESKEASNSESNASVEEPTPLSGEFIVKNKKYTFEGNDLAIVSVENKTNKNYSVTITGTYLDKDGKALKTETQTFDQYSAGYSGYFLFKPNMQFDKFTYEFKTKESDGPFYAKDIVFNFKGLSDELSIIDEQLAQNDYTKYPSIAATFAYRYTGEVSLYPTLKWILFSEADTIIAMIDAKPMLQPNQEFDSEDMSILLQTMEDKLVWPEEYKGNVRAVVIVKDAEKFEMPPMP